MHPLPALLLLIVLADAGVPMLFVTMPAMLIALAPIIGMETLLICRRLAYRPWPVLRATAAANVLSTIVGIPITWLALLACEMLIGITVSSIPALDKSHSPAMQVVGFILSAAWLPPMTGNNWWAVPLATLVLLVPFFFVSVWTEYYVMQRMLPVAATEAAQEGEISRGKLARAVRDANLLSYVFLFIFVCLSLVWSWLHT
jgi:hypothetical protein